ncbi:MAG: hypothetical protein GY842_16005, partial [bacterium]|nr:hypothetical protein [bacterium]
VSAGTALAGEAQSIHTVARAGQVEQVRTMLERSPELIEAKNRAGQTALHAAAYAGRTDVVEFLLAHGASVAAADQQQAAPLHLAVSQLRTEVVARLLEAKADPNASTKSKMSPLALLADRRIGSADDTKSCAAIARLLLEAGAETDAPNADGYLPLHLAAIRGNLAILDPLLAAEADVTTGDAREQTALHHAARGNHQEFIKRLLAGKAPLDAVDRNGETPLHAAARRFRAEAIDLLLTAGAQVNATSKAGMTPLILLAAHSEEDRGIDHDGAFSAAAQVLLKAGAKLDAKDSTGTSALHYAVKNKHANLAEFLRKHGAAE